MAATGFLALGHCFATQQQAGDYVAASLYPRQEQGVLYSVWAVAPNGVDAVDVSIFAHNFATDTRQPIYSLVIFPRCDVAVPVNPTISPFNALDAAAFWSFGMTMVVGVWLLSHNAGAIWRFIAGRKL